MIGVNIELRNVQKKFASGVHAVKDLNLEVSAGEFVSILGPSGCGKSTLLRMIAGLENSTGGELLVEKSKTAFVFQDAHLLPWRTVLQNVCLPLEIKKKSSVASEAAARAALSQVGLADFAEAYPAQLSGGMRMRVSLARALVTDPDLLLLDEPFAALDEITRQALDEDLRLLWEKKKFTVLFVTHSVREAAFLSNRAVVLSHRPARVLLDKTLDLPSDRKREIQTSISFSQELSVLSQALERAE